MVINRLRVNLNNRSYFIYIGSKILHTKNFFFILPLLSRCVLVTNEFLYNILELEKDKKNSIFQKIEKKIIIKDTENKKNLDSVNIIISYLLKHSLGRDTILIAFGGGIIGDIVGFCASIYQRGIEFFQIPTTLLSQVDASIGGKTGVNHLLGKNMIGTFWQPKYVITDSYFLKYLPKKHIISGMSEIIKYAIISDKSFFYWLEKNHPFVVSLSSLELLYCINRCCEIKSKIIEEDETERNVRVFLNLGHSFAHAIETYTGYNSWMHGEAVSVGISMASYFSYVLGFLSKEKLFRIIRLLRAVGLPIYGPSDMQAHHYLSIMLRDKKTLHGKMRFVLPVKIGKVKLYTHVDDEILLNSITSFQKKKYAF